MKAQPLYSKFVLKNAIQAKKKSLKGDIEDLKQESKIHRQVRRLDLPCVLQYSVSSNSVTLHEPSGGWKNEKEFHKTLAGLVRQLGVRMERKFSEYSGAYYWTGTTSKGLSVTLYGAAKPENCEVVEYTETVKRYKSVCGKPKEGAVTSPVG